MSEKMIKAFKALGSPKRFEVVSAIRDMRSKGERPTFDALMKALKLVPGDLGYHVKVLKEAGLIENGVDGYKLTPLAETLTGEWVIISKKILREKLEQAEEMYKATRDERVKFAADAIRWLMSIAKGAK